MPSYLRKRIDAGDNRSRRMRGVGRLRVPEVRSGARSPADVGDGLRTRILAAMSGELKSDAKPGQVRNLDVAWSVLLYTVARLGLVVVLAFVIFGIGLLVGVMIPPVVAAVFAVLIALPLGMFAFKGLRLRVNTQIAALEEERKRRREDLRSRMNDG